MLTGSHPGFRSRLLMALGVSVAVVFAVAAEATAQPPAPVVTHIETVANPAAFSGVGFTLCTYTSTWEVSGAKGRWAHYQVRFDGSGEPMQATHDLHSGTTLTTTYAGRDSLTIELRLAKKNGTPITGWVTSGQIDC